MSLENLLAQDGEQNRLPESLTTSIKDLNDKDLNDNGIFRDRMTTKEKEDLMSQKVDADKEPLDKDSQELRRRIDKDIVNGNYDDISQIIATTKPEQLDKVLQKVISDVSGEQEIRSFPRIVKDENGQTSLYIQLGTPPYACYFGEHAVSITAKGVEFIYGNSIRYPEPGSLSPTLK